MQLMPRTAVRFGVLDRFDIDENLRGGVAYLAWLLRLFHGDLRLAVAAYQAGESRSFCGTSIPFPRGVSLRQSGSTVVSGWATRRDRKAGNTEGATTLR